MKKLLFLLSTASFCGLAYAQSPSIIWAKTYGGTAFDASSSIQPVASGGYILCGSVSSNDGVVSGNHGGGDFWVAKLSDTGGLQWQKCYGGTQVDGALCMQPTADGGFVVIGDTRSTDGDVTTNNGYQDYWVVKLSATGSIQWQKTFGGGLLDHAVCVQQTYDGGYILGGIVSSTNGMVTGHHGGTYDIWMVKLDGTGTLLWQKCLGGSKDEQLGSIRQTADSGYIVAGTTASADGDVSTPADSTDYWIVKLSASGSIQWNKTYGGSGYEKMNCVRQTPDGGYIAAGVTTSNDGDVLSNHGTFDCWMLKLSATGNIQWQKSLGGTAMDEGISIELSSDGGYIVAGSTASSNGDVTGSIGGGDYWVFKLSPTGSLVWQKCLGGSAGDAAWDIHKTADGHLIVTGMTYSSNGDVTGKLGTGMTSDIWVVRLYDSTNRLDVPTPALEESIAIVPNPTAGHISVVGADKVTIRVYDIVGRLVTSAANTSSISVADQPAGMYLVSVFDERGILLKREKITKR